MSWLQNTFQGLLFKNVAFNLTIQGLILDRTIGNGKKASRGMAYFFHCKKYAINWNHTVGDCPKSNECSAH